jgi:metal-dependent amidase/aminoacylase/carboxypeptidase family protein
MNRTLRTAVAALFLAASALPAAAQTDPHQHEQPAPGGPGSAAGMGGMMGAQDMGGMMRMMQGCPMMQGGGQGLPHLPPGNEKLELQMHADMMKAMGDILARYAARLPEKK